MASSIMASFANMTLTPIKSIASTSTLLKAFSSASIAPISYNLQINQSNVLTTFRSQRNGVLATHPNPLASFPLDSSRPTLSLSALLKVPSRGYKSKTYRNVKSYTFGMGQVNHNGHATRSKPRYEKDPKMRPLKSGIPFGYKVINYEHTYVSDVGYRAEYYKGGPKPRFNDEEKEHMEKYMTQNAPVDEWDEKEALFGQNDYIDILGDGNLSIRELNVDAPPYLRGWGFKGEETTNKFEEIQFHHNLRRLHFEEDYLLNLRPTRWWQLRKELCRNNRAMNRYKKRCDQRWAPN